VVGHIDRAWTYSFKWKDAGQQTQTFTDTLRRLFFNHRLGNALDEFNQRYAQLSTTLSNWYDQSQVRKPTVAELLGDWTANNDARGYALFGDPAAKLAVTTAGGTASNREGLPVELFQTKNKAGSSFGAEAKPDAGATASEIPPAGEGQSEKVSAPLPPKSGLGGSVPPDSSSSTGLTNIAGAPYIINNSNGGVVNIYPRGVRGVSRPAESGSEEADFATSIYGTETGAVTGQPGVGAGSTELANVRSKLADFLSTLGQKLDELTSLEVKTYVSSDLSQVKPVGGQLDGPDLQPRAMTVMRLNGNTEIVVPTDEAGGIDSDLWAIHRQTFDQAQAWRESLVKAISNLVTGFIPGK
jgi:hypothetical protein